LTIAAIVSFNHFYDAPRILSSIRISGLVEGRITCVIVTGQSAALLTTLRESIIQIFGFVCECKLHFAHYR